MRSTFRHVAHAGRARFSVSEGVHELVLADGSFYVSTNLTAPQAQELSDELSRASLVPIGESWEEPVQVAPDLILDVDGRHATIRIKCDDPPDTETLWLASRDLCGYLAMEVDACLDGPRPGTIGECPPIEPQSPPSGDPPSSPTGSEPST